jgi:hypothetical protein
MDPLYPKFKVFEMDGVFLAGSNKEKESFDDVEKTFLAGSDRTRRAAVATEQEELLSQRNKKSCCRNGTRRAAVATEQDELLSQQNKKSCCRNGTRKAAVSTNNMAPTKKRKMHSSSTMTILELGDGAIMREQICSFLDDRSVMALLKVQPVESKYRLSDAFSWNTAHGLIMTSLR